MIEQYKAYRKLASVRLKDEGGLGQNQVNGIEKNVIKLRFFYLEEEGAGKRIWRNMVERTRS
jgi:hypothetical protein